MISAVFSTRQRRYLVSVLYLVWLLGNMVNAQVQAPQQKLKANLKNYIRQYSDEAVSQMIEFKIPASVILAQAIFESGSGTSDLALKSNNHFGIKCHLEWEGDTITKHDDTLNECFRKYFTVQESYTDHSMFLSTRQRYAFLFDIPLSNYAEWCYGIKNAGYATYPTYAEDLIKVIEDEKLYELDNIIVLKPRGIICRISPPVYAPKEIPLPNPISNLTDLCKEGLMWLDEKDVLIQSLDMIVDASDEQPVLAAE